MATVQQYIGYDNIVTISNVLATSAATGFPVTNLANPATNLKWKSDSTSEQYVTITNPTGAAIDYIGIAAHNLSASLIDVEGQEVSDGAWVSIIDAAYVPANNRPIMLRVGSPGYGCSWNQDGSNSYATWDQSADSYTKGYYTDPSADSYISHGKFIAIRLKITPNGSTKPQIGVLFAGAIMQLERGVYVGHTPITYGRSVAEVNGMAESGDFLGRIIRQTSYDSAIKISNITPTWYRSTFEPFVLASATRTFFYSWRLNDYKTEIGYCWVSGGVPVPENTGPGALMGVSFKIGGIA